MSDKPSRENQRQHAAFLAYSEMPEPSVEKLYESWKKLVPKFEKPKLRTLKYWCNHYKWVERSEAIHQAAKEEVVRKAVSDATMKKEEILAITRAVMIRYGAQLRDNTQGKITAIDFEKAWKIQRIELGLPTEIGKQQVEMKDEYSDLTDEELIAKFERATRRYKEKLKKNETNKNETADR